MDGLMLVYRQAKKQEARTLSSRERKLSALQQYFAGIKTSKLLQVDSAFFFCSRLILPPSQLLRVHEIAPPDDFDFHKASLALSML